MGTILGFLPQSLTILWISTPCLFMSESVASAPMTPPSTIQWPVGQLIVLGLGLAAMLLPTYVTLSQVAWMKDDNGHAPMIIALSFWLMWSDRAKIFAGPAKPAMISGWVVLLIGVFAYILGRSQSIDTVEAGSHILLIMACLLMIRGWDGVKRAWFPLFFLIFMVPLPGVLVQAITMPLKVVVSIVAENILHLAGYPIGRSGVTLTLAEKEIGMMAKANKVLRVRDL